MANRALIDCFQMKLHLQGPGGTNFDFAPGTVSVDLVLSPSGHLMLPCCEFQQLMHKKADSRVGGVKLDVADELALQTQDLSASNIQAQDRWEKHGWGKAAIWRRRHGVPRRNLFAPAEHPENADAPDTDYISSYRKTTAIFHDGSTEIIEDNWHDSEQTHRQLGAPWTGVTEFWPVGQAFHDHKLANGGYVQHDRI